MPMEIANEIRVGHLQNLGIDETKGVPEKQPEMSKEYLLETEKTPDYVFPNQGQVVPYQNTVLETEDKLTELRGLYQAETNKKVECPTVPQMQIDEKLITSPEKRIEVDDKCLEDGECFQEQGQEEQPNNVLVMAKEQGFCGKKFQWPAMGIRNQNAKSENTGSNDKTAVFQQPVLNENEQSPGSSTSPASDPDVITTTMNNPQSAMMANTTDACLEQEDNNTEQSYIHPSSILKKDSGVTGGKQRSVHFPENINIVSVRLYDVSDDEDSDADTVILYSDDEESLAGGDQQVPLNNFSESFSLFANDHDCSSSHPASLSKVMNMDFKPQFSFPPALKIANYQLFDSPDEEEQMFEHMEISVEEIDVAEVVTTTETEFEDSNYGLYDDASPTATPSVESESEKVSSVEELKEIEHSNAYAVESHVGINKGSSAEDTRRNKPDTAEMDMGTCSNGKQGDDDTYPDNTGLEEHEDAENKMSVGTESMISSRQDMTSSSLRQDVTSSSRRQDVTSSSLRQDVMSSSLGRCDSRLMWRGRRTIDSMLIDEAFHVPPMLTKNEGIRLINILQTIEEEVPCCHEQMIDVVTHETNFLMLPQEKTKSAFIGPSQCHVGQEKHVIQFLVSSPDHFDNFDLAWESKPYSDSMHNERDGDVLKDTTEDDRCTESVSSKKDPLFENNRVTDADINKSKQIIAVEGAGGRSPEYEHATKFDKQKELSFSSDFSEEETQVARPTTASMKRGHPTLQSLPEGCTILNSNKHLKTDLAASPQKHSLTISKDPQKRQIQIVPEIETGQESRKRPDVQSTEASLHTVPPEVDDIMDYNTPFHLDEQTFQKCCITEGKTTYDSDQERLKTINMFTKEENTDHIAQLQGYDIHSTKFNAKFKQDVESQKGHACENRRGGKNHFDWETRNDAVNDHSVFKTATGLYSSETHFLAKYSRKHLRVGLSKSTKVKRLHPYWSKNKIK